jgi:flagellin-like hook-associated protein FlgL
MKMLKISSLFISREISKNVDDLRLIQNRLSSGKILPQDSPSSLSLSRSLKLKVESLEFISQHITKISTTLQNYESVIRDVSSFVEKLKSIALRASQTKDSQEFSELANAYQETFSALQEFVKKSTFLSKVLARGGFSNSVLAVEVISGQVNFSPKSLDASGLNFRKYGIEEGGKFEIKIQKSGDTIQATLFVNGSAVFSETKDLVSKPSDMPFFADFEDLGIRLQVPPNSGDFEVKFKVSADPILTIFGDGLHDEERFFLPSLEPDFLGIPANINSEPEKIPMVLDIVLSKLSQIRAEVGEKLSKLNQRNDFNDIIKSKLKIMNSSLEEADFSSESVILSLKQVMLSANISTAQRAIVLIREGINMLMRR